MRFTKKKIHSRFSTKPDVENFTKPTIIYITVLEKGMRKKYIGHHAKKPFRCKNVTPPHVKFIQKDSKYNLCWSECSEEHFQ